MSENKTIVNSWNEWDPLKHVIVGRADGTCIPAPEPALDAKVPEDSDMRGQFGPRTKDTVDKANELFAELGYLQYRTFGYGHSFGMLSHFYGREAGLELREDIDTVLEENMVVSMEPMIMIPEGNPGAGGYREHDILVIGKDGAENITKFPFGPEHNIIKN